jgi:hypothetical protein
MLGVGYKLWGRWWWGRGSDEVTDGRGRGLQLYYCAYLCVYSQS